MSPNEGVVQCLLAAYHEEQLGLLNDEILNFCMNIIVDHGENSKDILPKVYTLNIFFYSTLVKDGYERLKKWTQRVDLFSSDFK